MSNTKTLAAALGQLGGRARARRLSAERRRQIASAGGIARRRSLDVAQRLVDNFAYAAAMRGLAGAEPVVARVKTCKGPLPGLYPKRK